jgi:formiminotetrahydrofolate cyclodeaminase
MNLLWLGGAVGTGASDEAGGAEWKPRDAAYDILSNIEKQLNDAKTGLANLNDKDIPAFNKTMAGKLPTIK